MSRGYNNIGNVAGTFIPEKEYLLILHSVDEIMLSKLQKSYINMINKLDTMDRWTLKRPVYRVFCSASSWNSHLRFFAEYF